MNRTLIRLAGFGLLTAAAPAQSTLFEIDGDGQNDRFGNSVSPAGDVDNDGVEDFVVGAPENGNVFSGGTGYARVYSGVDASVLLTISGVGGAIAFGNSVAGVGDLNGDGHGDIAVGAPFEDGPGLSRGRIYVYSGIDGSLIRTFTGVVDGGRLGHTVASAGDANGDGVPDIAGCAFNSDVNGLNTGTVVVWSGATGSELQRHEGNDNNAHLGVSMSCVGDANGDGRDDLLVGGEAGPVYLFSGATGSTLRTYSSPSSSDLFGSSVAGLGDLTGDGFPEVLIGAPQNSVFGSSAGYARVLNGSTGQLIDEFVGDQVGNQFGYAVAPAGDHDGDGTLDYLVGAPGSSQQNTPGYARVYSGANGAILRVFIGEDDSSRIGAAVTCLGDLHGDGSTEIVIAEPDAGTPGVFSGQIEVFSGSAPVCGAPANFCLSLPNSSGQAGAITFTGSSSVAANDLVLHASACPPGQFGLFFYGSTQVFVPFGSGIRCVGGQLFRLQPPQTVDGSGSASLALDINAPANPLGQVSVGQTWNYQFWFRDPGDGGAGTNQTDGLEVTFCP